MTEYNESEREWTIRDYREGDEEQILELRKIALSGSRDKQWWKWMYRDGPAGPAVIMLAEENQRIIGHQAYIFLNIKIGDQVTRGCHGVDLMVHPDYRRQGIFITLTNILDALPAASGRSVEYGTPNNRSRPGLIKHLDFLNICEAPLLVKVVDWGSIFKKRYKIPALAGKLLGYAWEHITKRIPSPKNTGIEVKEAFSFDERIDKFWQKASKLKNIMVVKDRKYLNWRYVAKPGKEYRIFIAKKKQEIAGYIVVKLKKGVRSRGYIIDLLTLPDEDTVATLLITKAIRCLKEDGATTVSCWMLPDTPYYRTLRKLGFIRRLGPPFCIRIYDQNLSKEFMTNPSNWYFVAGDNDSI